MTEVVERVTNVKNERRREERHGGGRGCEGHNGQDIVAEEDPSGRSQMGINGRKRMMIYFVYFVLLSVTCKCLPLPSTTSLVFNVLLANLRSFSAAGRT